MKNSPPIGIAFFNTLKTLLEELFQPDWFIDAREKTHPAYVRWLLCKRLIEQDGILRFPDEWGILPTLGQLLLDSYNLVALTKGNMTALKLGGFDLIGDEAALTKVRSRIGDPRQYADLMVELYVAAWHRGRGHVIHLVEQEGWPDLRVDVPQIASPLLIECKRIEHPSENRINAVVKKANQQIKRAKQELGCPCCGVVVLDIATQCTVELLRGQPLPYKPKDVIDATEMLDRACKGKNSAIDYALLVWDMYTRWERPPGHLECRFMRNVHVRELGRESVPILRLGQRLEQQTFHPTNSPIYMGDTAFFRIGQAIHAESV